jgi:hypothetical protein
MNTQSNNAERIAAAREVLQNTPPGNVRRAATRAKARAVIDKLESENNQPPALTPEQRVALDLVESAGNALDAAKDAQARASDAKLGFIYSINGDAYSADELLAIGKKLVELQSAYRAASEAVDKADGDYYNATRRSRELIPPSGPVRIPKVVLKRGREVDEDQADE